MIEVLSPGPQATIQDGGRSGHGHLGVPRAGAMDPLALSQANRLVGNPAETAAIEFLLGGFTIRFTEAASFSLTGAPVAAYLGPTPVSRNRWTYARPGDALTAGPPAYGLWTYLAVAGGIDVPPVLSSRSTDSLSGLGPPPLAPRDVLPVGSGGGTPAVPSDVFVENASAGRRLELSFHWGPRADWFTEETCRTFRTATWRVSSEVDRVAARLTGPRLPHQCLEQLPTEGVHPGSIQVPPSGQPLVFLANHPPTGGYPVIGVLCERDLGRMAQAAPGTMVSMRATRAGDGTRRMNKEGSW
ncbi:allophanate hydrolase [Amycolatopsis taiwanensis]|uniref:Allophanate hydrolase n=1 Tax=Amycolatopsis taiwanensis TaxID=342230 RepID=A0A9W6VFR0_9PSEU|nr:allophanate hydrolase [Amycolatopsis taiwanensis]